MGLEKITQNICKNWIEELQKHIIDSNNLINLLNNRVIFFKKTVNEMNEARKQSEHLGLSLNNTQDQEALQNHMKKDETRLKYLNKHIKSVVTRSIDYIRSVPPTKQVVAQYKIFLRNLEEGQI